MTQRPLLPAAAAVPRHRVAVAASCAWGAAIAAAAIAVFASPAAAHSGQAAPEGLYWAIWFDPKLALVLAIPTLWVATAVFGLRRRLGGPETLPRRTLILYPLAIALYYLGSATSLDEIGERYLFTFHMAQHSLFVYVVAPLLVLSLPEWVLQPVLANRVMRPLTYWMTRPIPAYVTFHALFAFWHIPGFYEWALRDRQIHDLEHASFILSACLMWWPLLGQMQHSAPRIPTPGVKLLYILFLEVAQMPMFAFLCLGDKAHYPTYRAAPRITYLTPFEDQFVGGMLMHLVAAVALVATGATIFAQWANAAAAADTPTPPPAPQQPQHSSTKPQTATQPIL